MALNTKTVYIRKGEQAPHYRQDLLTRQRSGSLQSLMFIHLKLGLDAPAIDWINCDSPGPGTEPGSSVKVTVYHIPKDLQRKNLGHPHYLSIPFEHIVEYMIKHCVRKDAGL